MKLVLGALLCLALCTVPINSVNNKLKEVFSWKFMDYAWEKPEDREAAIASGEFVPANNLPLGLEVWKDKLFITIPRWKNGVVSTLNYVKLSDEEPGTPEPTEEPETLEPTEEPETPEPTEEPDTPETTEEPDTPETTEEPDTPEPTEEPETTETAEEPNTPETTEEPTTPDDDEDSTLITANIYPMPARMVDLSGDEEETRLLRRSAESDDEENVDIIVLTRSSNCNGGMKRCKKGKGEDEKSKKKEKPKKERPEKEKDKKKKKKKCTKKPKPTTAAPPPPSPTTAPETTETETTVVTETTVPPTPRSPALIPYPSFAANRVLPAKRSDEPAPIVSVFRVWADTCDRLWVMDTGVADILGKTEVVSKPRILIYNLNNDELVKSYEFKDTDSEEHSFFANIIVDTDPKNCDKAFAYVPDLGGYGIVSYDFANDKSRRIKHNYFHFDPLAGNMKVGGVNFQWTDGVFSIALGKPMDDGFRTAYFHCLASTKEFSVNTKVLKNEDSVTDSYYDYKLVGDRGADSQSSASYIHEDTGVMFYTQLQKDSVNCWNTNKPMTSEHLVEVASDNETMIFTNDLKVDREGNLWVLTDKLPVFIYRSLDDSEVNYRIFTSTVEDAIAGTNCAP